MISSLNNATVKATARLRKRRERERRGAFLVEGHRAAAVALSSGARFLALLHTPAARRRRAALVTAAAATKVHEVSNEVMAFLTDSAHPPDVLAVVPLRPAGLGEAVAAGLVVVLAGVRDPAVAGGILAAGAAAGARGAVALRGTADVFAPAAVRAAAGAHFALRLAAGADPAAVAGALEGRRVAALSEDGVPVCSASMREIDALVVCDGEVPAAFAAARRVSIPAGDRGVAAGLVARAAIALHEVTHS